MSQCKTGKVFMETHCCHGLLMVPVLVWDWDVLLMPQSSCVGLGGFGNVLVQVWEFWQCPGHAWMELGSLGDATVLAWGLGDAGCGLGLGGFGGALVLVCGTGASFGDAPNWRWCGPATEFWVTPVQGFG